MSGRLGVMLVDGSFGRSHAALVLVTGAAAIGREVTLFATGAGVRALLADWSGLAGSEEDTTLRARGVAGFEALREAAASLGVRLIACEAGMAGEALDTGALAAGVEVAGVATVLADATGQMIAI